MPASRRDALAATDGDFFSKSLSRDTTVTTQTPQVVRRDILIDVFACVRKNGWEEQSIMPLCALAGYPVRMIPGQDDNLKITYSEDWEFARSRLEE